MRIDTVTKYRCDGCGKEDTATYGWISMVPLASSGMTLTMTTGTAHSEDYCATCLDRMRVALPIRAKPTDPIAARAPLKKRMDWVP